MKTSTLFIFCLLLIQNISYAQEESNFTKDGKWLIEVGGGSFNPLGGATFASFLFPEGGGSTSSYGIEGGKFISEDFAIIGRFGFLSTGGGVNFTTITGGGKYYINGVIPVKVGAGAAITGILGSSSTSFLGNASIGYAVKLADNILLEPNVGFLYADGSAFTLGLTFALVL